MSRLRIQYSHRPLKVATLSVLLVASFSWSVSARDTSRRTQSGEPSETLAEIRDKQRVALIVTKSSVVDASGSDDRIIAEALAADPKEARRHRYPYGVIARKLNQYTRKYRSLRPAYELAEADFIIYFRLVEYRRLLNGFYPYGELFVILNQPTEDTPPAKLLWRSRKVMYAEDAVKDLVKELKLARGER